MQLHIFPLILMFMLTACGANLDCPEGWDRACMSKFRLDFLDEDNLAPSLDEMRQVCSIVIPALECVKEHEVKCGSQKKPFYPKFLPFAKEACQETSSIFKAYGENVECFNYNRKEVEACSFSAKEIVNPFIKHVKNESDFNREYDVYLYECLPNIFTIPCISEKLEKVCGNDMKNTFDYLAKKYKEIVIDYNCEPDKFTKLMRDFFEFLKN